MTDAGQRRRIYSDLNQRAETNAFDYQAQTSYIVARLHRLMRHSLVDAFEPLGASFAEFAVLSIVRSVEPLTNAELARLTSVSPQATYRLVSGLVARGYLERLDGPGGLQPIVLSESGLRLHEEMSTVEVDVMTRLAVADADWRQLLSDLVERGEALIADTAEESEPQ